MSHETKLRGHDMRRFDSQSGEGKAGCLFWVLVLLVGFMVGSKVIPIKIASMELKDHMEELAMTQPRAPQHLFEREIANRARELRLEVPKDNIRVRKTKERVIMDVQFVVPVDLVVYTYNWNVKIYLDRDIFII